MSKKEIYISYTTEYGKIWDVLIKRGLIPKILPPPIKVIWEGTPEVNKSDKYDDKSYTTARLNTHWSYLPDKQLLNLYDYYIVRYHYNFIEFISERNQFKGKLNADAQLFYVLHDIIHEICHFIAAYKKWSKKYDNSNCVDEEGFIKLYKHIRQMGTVEDEKENEYDTLTILTDLLGISMLVIPSFDGPYVQGTPEFYRTGLAMFTYWYYDYQRMFCGLDKDEESCIIKRQWEIIDYVISKYDENEKIIYVE